MPKRTMEIQFPMLGVVRRHGLRASSNGRGPFPAVWAENVRLEDGLTNRLRGGSFAGIDADLRPEEIIYRDRKVTFVGNAILTSRMGSHTDLDFQSDVTDTLAPQVFQLSEAKGSGPVVVAVIAHKDQYLLGFSATETWVLSGDPATGTLRRVSDEVGIIGVDAWCVAHDTVYFLSDVGLYRVGADGSGLEAVSEDKIPEDLDSATNVTLTYEHSSRGVYIHKDGTDWFYDTERDGFWPFDQGTNTSHVVLGPFRLGNANSYGRINMMHGIMAAGSADVSWRIVTGTTAEGVAATAKAAVEADSTVNVDASGTWEAGRSHVVYPRTRAVWCCLWLRSTGTWAYEGIAMDAMASGKWR